MAERARDDQGDWTGTHSTDKTSFSRSEAGPEIVIRSLSQITPLDQQFGAFPKLSVPEDLRELLFGQPETGQLGTFAVLDAASIPGLPEFLEASAAPHLCFVKGELLEDLGEVMPWIVELSPESPLTRALMTKGDAPRNLWGRYSGMLLRAQADLHSLWRHFRKFTRVLDDEDKPYYLRFWDRSSLNAARRDGFSDPFYRKLLGQNRLIWHDPEPQDPERLWLAFAEDRPHS